MVCSDDCDYEGSDCDTIGNTVQAVNGGSPDEGEFEGSDCDTVGNEAVDGFSKHDMGVDYVYC